MSFVQFCPASNLFYPGNSGIQNCQIPQNYYQYAPEIIQQQMMMMHQHNSYLQYQYLQQNYPQFFEQQQVYSANQNQVKIEEPIQNIRDAYEQNPAEQTDKLLHQTETVSKNGSKKMCNKIKKPKPQKNETKNIPKNYGKAIIAFIQTNKEMVKTAISKHSQMSYVTFMNLLRMRKNKINSIADLRSFWLQNSEQDFPKIARILSNMFLRHFSLQYIFNSRVSNYAGHIKYRTRLIEALKDPQCFTSIKQY